MELVKGIDLAMVRTQMEAGQKLWLEELRLAKDGGKGMPPKSLYVEFILHFDAKVEATSENVYKLTHALDAAYCHLDAIHHQSTKSTYKCQPQDWIDNQQLMYLADPQCTFVTADEKLIAKLEECPAQSGRVCRFDEFMASNT